jgi:hypothetical protein
MSKFRFTNEDDNGTVTTKEFEAVSLVEILEELKMFLLGCGFHINGSITIYRETDDDDCDAEWVRQWKELDGCKCNKTEGSDDEN